MTPSPPEAAAAPPPDPLRLGSGAMFDGIAERYDLLNRLMSLGIDEGWRRRAVRAAALGPGARVLDVATGTGDLALALARSEPSARVTGLDPSRAMLAVGARKVARDGLAERIALVPGDAQALPFEAASFDAVTIAFGIRNVPDRALALREMARVTRPGGRLAVLELSEPGPGPLGWGARLWVHHVVPALGAALSGSREYGYLQASIAAFPPAAEFAGTVRAAGWEVERVEPLTFGVAHLYRGRRVA